MRSRIGFRAVFLQQELEFQSAIEGSRSNEVDAKSLSYLSEKINETVRHDNDPALTPAPPEGQFKDAA